jgi:glycosyltransferase involved in cell wall biosynthesis
MSATPTRPHVLYVTPIFGYPAFGGPRLRTYNTLKALARRADVTLYLTQQPDTVDREAARAHLLTFCRDVVFPEPPAEPSGGRALARRLARQVVPPGLRAALRGLRLWKNHAAPAAEGTARPAEDVAALRDWMLAHRPDLLWLGFGGISYDLVRLKAETGTPVVLETECVWSRFVLREVPFAPDAARRERILAEGRAKEAEERAGATLVDMTTAVSDVDAEYFRHLAPDPERVMLLANVIDVEAYAAETSGAETVRLQQPALVFAGTLSHGTANVDATLWLLDQVMPLVWRRRPDVHLYVVGRSPAAPILARRGPRVHVTGEVPSVVPYMRAATAALVPLRWESGTRFKILEAFACQTPVVSTTLGAEGLAVEHGRDLLLADDPQAFASAILSLVEDPSIGQRLVGPAYELVRRHYGLTSAERQIGAILARLELTAAVPVS